MFFHINLLKKTARSKACMEVIIKWNNVWILLQTINIFSARHKQEARQTGSTPLQVNNTIKPGILSDQH